MSGSGGDAVSQVLMAVARFELGRVVMWILATLLGLMALATWGSKVAAFPLVLAMVLVFFALAGMWRAHKERQTLPIRWLLPRVALAVAGLGIVALLLWMRNRRRPAEALPPPPRPEEVDLLASAELEGERAA